MAIFVSGIDEIFRNDATGNLQTCDITIKPTPHLRPIKTTGGPQFTCDQRPLLQQSEQYRLFDGALRWRRMQMATIVAEIRPPLTTDEASLSSEELARLLGHIGNNISLMI